MEIVNLFEDARRELWCRIDVAIDLQTNHAEAAEYFAANRVWAHRSRLEGHWPVRVRVDEVD